jgi:preprotein translocase subunit SecE
VSTVATSADGPAGPAQRVGGFFRKTVGYMREVRAEVNKVTWPTWEELRQTTVVIIVFVVIIGLIIGVMDIISSWVLIDLLGRLLR